MALVLLPTLQAGPIERLHAWVDRARIAPGSVDDRKQEDLRSILGDLRILRRTPGAAREVDLGLVELASLEWRDTRPAELELQQSARLARAELETALADASDELARRLSLEVLAPAARRPRNQRLIAAQLLAGTRLADAFPVLRAAAREEDRDLARAALTALCGWPTPAVHAFFLEQLASRVPCTRIASEHFERCRDTLDELVREGLEREVARRYLSEDWREAARARWLGRALNARRAAPILIEALATWERRAQEGSGSRRIRAEILAELQRLSGRAIPGGAERWTSWWQGVVEGRTELPEEILAAGGQPSSATFFGLHAATDRVLFVVDRSGSMRAAFGTDGRTRIQEAVEQMEHFLRQSGPDTRFNVALFSNRGSVWRSRLTPATEGNLQLARRWLEDRDPEGGTHLFEGLRAGLALDRSGALALERCEADTVIVLCDGDTSEGPAWIRRWLAEENDDRAEIVFHCVQIGNSVKGTLEALAAGSGGEFVRVQG